VKIYVETYGCQMNVSDSGKIHHLFAARGYRPTGNSREADLIVINTCSVREKPELKLFSALGRYIPLKRKNPGLVIAVGGCVAQQWGEKLLKKSPGLDIVFGTHQFDRLPEMVEKVRKGRRPQSATEFVSAPGGLEVPARPGPDGISAMVTIMQGCDNFCSYCIVPYVRGREYSRPAEAIIAEVEGLVASGVCEIMLLGQNVNSYGLKTPGGIGFPELLYRVAAIPGVRRLRFTTSHPKDLSDDLIAAFGELDNLCPALHLPLQAGSNAVLERMGRGYSVATYLKKVEKLRRVVPEIALTTDIIVGFPGETEADFARTLKMLAAVRYDQIFSFKYSVRPGTRAAEFADRVSEEEKKERLARCHQLQDEITGEILAAQVGRTSKVMVTGLSKRGGSEWSGRTPENRIVNFPVRGRKPRPGELVEVRITEALKHSLRGEPAAGPERG
jgi:tRNA-2-methylthio-N6-dimethylallyladenosine synthase